MRTIFLASICVGASALVLSGCGGRAALHGEASIPAVFLTDGEVDYSNPYDPVTGENITDAVVTVIHEGTGDELVLDWYDEPSGNMERGSYGNYSQDFPHAPGESISLRVEMGNRTITGSPTVTPDSEAQISSPAHQDTVSLPLDVTWDVIDYSEPATHAFVFLSADDGSEAFMDVVALDDGAYTIDSGALSTTGAHHLTVWPTNIMELTGDVVEGSANHVKSTTLSYSHALTLE